MTPETVAAIQTFFTESVLSLAINAVGAIAILVVGWWLAGVSSRAVGRALERSARVDDTLKPLATSLTRYAVLIVTLVAVLGRFGVQTTSIVAVFGAAGLAIGLALQGTLSNVAAGVMLLVLRPFRLGDAILVAGQVGTVKEIGLFTTELTTPENLYVSLPNSSIWNAPIVNYTRHATRRFDLTIGIAYDSDIDHAIGLALEVLQADERIQAEPAPMVAVRLLGASSVDLVLRGFVKQSDFWPTSFGVQKAVKEAFDDHGIEIPFPQRTVHFAAGAPPLAAAG